MNSAILCNRFQVSIMDVLVNWVTNLTFVFCCLYFFFLDTDLLSYVVIWTFNGNQVTSFQHFVNISIADPHVPAGFKGQDSTATHPSSCYWCKWFCLCLFVLLTVVSPEDNFSRLSCVHRFLHGWDLEIIYICYLLHVAASLCSASVWTSFCSCHLKTLDLDWCRCCQLSPIQITHQQASLLSMCTHLWTKTDVQLIVFW